MFSLFGLLNKAFDYTKNHKILWFFGFFLTSWGGLSFLRRIDFRAERFWYNFNNFEQHLANNPTYYLLIGLAGLCALLLAFYVGAIARAILIDAATSLEEKKIFTLAESVKRTKNKYTRLFVLSLAMNATMLIIFVALFAPLSIAFSRGLINQTILLSLAALAIYLPLVITISLVNIFASCYIVIFDLGIMKAVRAAFDLIGNFFDKVLALFLVLTVIYAISFIFSFMLLGTVSGLIYFLGFNLKTLAISSFFGIIVAVLVILALTLILINAILNAFTNISWTLFFHQIIKAERFAKTESALAHTGG